MTECLNVFSDFLCECLRVCLCVFVCDLLAGSLWVCVCVLSIENMGMISDKSFYVCGTRDEMICTVES